LTQAKTSGISLMTFEHHILLSAVLASLRFTAREGSILYGNETSFGK
jgi:hypothetical protein